MDLFLESILSETLGHIAAYKRAGRQIIRRTDLQNVCRREPVCSAANRDDDHNQEQGRLHDSDDHVPAVLDNVGDARGGTTAADVRVYTCLCVPLADCGTTDVPISVPRHVSACRRSVPVLGIGS